MLIMTMLIIVVTITAVMLTTKMTVWPVVARST